MDGIDRRVRILSDVLLDRGFGWLAVEIIEAIESGREDIEDIDNSVLEQRIVLNQKLQNRQDFAASKPETLKYAASRKDSFRSRLDGDDQVRIAIDIFVDRLASAAEMNVESAAGLTFLMRVPVSLSVQSNGVTARVSLERNEAVAVKIRENRTAIFNWLISSTLSEEQ